VQEKGTKSLARGRQKNNLAAKNPCGVVGGNQKKKETHVVMISRRRSAVRNKRIATEEEASSTPQRRKKRRGKSVSIEYRNALRSAGRRALTVEAEGRGQEKGSGGVHGKEIKTNSVRMKRLEGIRRRGRLLLWEVGRKCREIEL